MVKKVKNSILKKRNVSEALKKKVASLQKFKCANSPGKKLKFIDDYECPLYKLSDGVFDESVWEIDHIIEFSKGGSDDINNLQALCSSCHKVKTKNFIISLYHNKESKNTIDKFVNSSIESIDLEYVILVSKFIKEICISSEYQTIEQQDFYKDFTFWNGSEVQINNNMFNNIIENLGYPLLEINGKFIFQYINVCIVKLSMIAIIRLYNIRDETYDEVEELLEHDENGIPKFVLENKRVDLESAIAKIDELNCKIDGLHIRLENYIESK